MIVAERKPLDEIKEMTKEYNKILMVGCATCVTVCMAGGEKEVGILATALKMAHKMQKKDIDIKEVTVERQCEWEFIEPLKENMKNCEAIVSLGCGAGVQTIAEMYKDKEVLPALNTKFIGIPQEQGIWMEKCLACGDCKLGEFGGICPIARCSKSILNGPCGGSSKGKCEINQEIDCGWQLIYDRMKTLNKLHLLEEVASPKNWSTSRDGGPRKVVREDMVIDKV
ncbi:MAG: methylenetetrahydrofolate reductase C-terminal domain-containing protein [bacterium]|nr:methylenetetrahydrofolate reductase C-terminal domain-containing protein [bacterium]